MNIFKLLPAIVLLACIAPAQDGPDQKPNVFLQNDRVKNQKESNTRIIDGTVKDASDNPLADAIVQLKDTKTSSIVNFATKEDGKYVFRDLPMDVNYELLAKHNELSTPVKKISIYDTRKHVILNFQLAAAKP
ncbi:MAG TPA: carboxypeptidase-like regulatory domain-containing protein [Bryobacteraceae bacterium]|nr:carboxypeptidase-like regulatory domain-containing protein [Bryobacteraceae bacterium]